MADDPKTASPGSTPPSDDKVSKADHEKQISELRSVKDKELAAAQRERDEALSQVRQLSDATGGDADAAKARLAEVISRERKLKEDSEGLSKRERDIAARELASQYGVDATELLKITDPKDMKVKALELYAEALKKGSPPANPLTRPSLDRNGPTPPSTPQKGTFETLRDSMTEFKKKGSDR